MKFLVVGLVLSFSMNLFAEEVKVKILEGKTSEDRLRQYTLVKGDTISDVLKKNGLDPLYGNGKYVNTALRINRLDEEQAKILNAGDILLLPVIEPNNVEYNEKLVYKNIYLDTQESKKAFDGRIFFTYSYFNSNIDLGNSLKLESERHNNYGIQLETDLNRVVRVYDFDLSGFLRVDIITTEDVNEVDNNGGKIKSELFYNLAGGIYFEKQGWKVLPYASWSLDKFTSSDIINDDIVKRRNTISWLGFGFKRDIKLKRNVIKLNASFNFATNSSSKFEGYNKESGLEGYKSSLTIQMQVNKKWIVGLDTSYMNFDSYNNYSIAKYSLQLGRGI
jgi:hypothetical protein